MISLPWFFVRRLFDIGICLGWEWIELSLSKLSFEEIEELSKGADYTIVVFLGEAKGLCFMKLLAGCNSTAGWSTLLLNIV